VIVSNVLVDLRADNLRFVVILSRPAQNHGSEWNPCALPRRSTGRNPYSCCDRRHFDTLLYPYRACHLTSEPST
jgi:hypothetical protein